MTGIHGIFWRKIFNTAAKSSQITWVCKANLLFEASRASESITFGPEGDMQGSPFDGERSLSSFKKGSKNEDSWLGLQIWDFNY